MIVDNTKKVNNPRKAGRKLSYRGTPLQLNRRILDHLYCDMQKDIITANLLVEIARDMRKALYQ